MPDLRRKHVLPRAVVQDRARHARVRRPVGLRLGQYDEAVKVVLTTGQASASYLQRRLRLGYSRAARLIEMMEANGIVGPSQGSKPREILIRADDYPGMDEVSGM